MLAIPALFTLLLTVALGFYVFVASPRNRAHQTFAAFNAFLALWTVKELLLWDPDFVDGVAHWWLPASLIIGLLMQYSLVVFAWVFPENHRTPKRKAAVLLAPGAVLIPATLLGPVFGSTVLRGQNLSIELSASGYLFVGYIVFIFCYGTATLFKKYRKYRGTREGQHLAAILWALAITAALQIVGGVILPSAGFGFVRSLSFIFVLPGTLIYAYAILNLKLFSLQSVLDQFRLFPIGYKTALSVASVAIISFVAFQVPIVWWSFREGMDLIAWKRYIVLSVVTALIPNLLLVLVILRSISRPLKRITVAAVQVAKGGYGTQVDLRNTNDEIGVLADSFNEMSRKMRGDIERMRDITDQLMRTEKLVAIGTLSAGIAHEINNPLASISSMIQILERRDTLDENTRAELQMISEQVSRISQVARDMMDFSRTGTSERAEIDVHQILNTALRIASFDRSFKRIRVVTEFDRGLPTVVADEDQMQQVFINLLLNAKDAMPSGGTITVSTCSEGGFAVVKVSDTGVGILLEDATRIFDPFFTTKPAGMGTGLGLAVCYGIVTAHQGTIDASKVPDGGATFTVRLPIIKL